MWLEAELSRPAGHEEVTFAQADLAPLPRLQVCNGLQYIVKDLSDWKASGGGGVNPRVLRKEPGCCTSRGDLNRYRQRSTRHY